MAASYLVADRRSGTRDAFLGCGQVQGRQMSLLRLLSIVAAALLATGAAPLQDASARLGRGPNTWSARSASGLTLQGTWTAAIDASTGAVTGTWTLVDATRRTAARGTWSAAKSSAGWTGAWRATRSGSPGEYSGSWSADADLPRDAPLGRLFEMATRSVVSGQWRAGGQSGGWSIRAFD